MLDVEIMFFVFVRELLVTSDVKSAGTRLKDLDHVDSATRNNIEIKPELLFVFCASIPGLFLEIKLLISGDLQEVSGTTELNRLDNQRVIVVL